MSSNISYRAPVTPRTSEGRASREEYLRSLKRKIDTERASHVRAPMSPRSEKGKEYNRARGEEAKKELEIIAAEQSGQNQECIGQGCMGKLKSGLSRISKVVGLSGGRRKTRRVGRKAHHAVRKTRHSRR